MAKFLTSEKGEEWLQLASQFAISPTSHLAEVEQLRRHLSPADSAAVIEQIMLRAKAIRRFPNAERMLFTDAGLQQATHPAVAAHRSQRYIGWKAVYDICCGIGSDTIALSHLAEMVVGVDRDPVRLCFAKHNARMESEGTRAHFVWADAQRPPFAINGVAVFCDPSRRTAAGKRIYQPQAYEPPLSQLHSIFGGAEGLGIKVAPSIPYAGVPWADEIEVTSFAGEVKEAVLWCGALATSGIRRRATILPDGHSMTDGGPYPECPVRQPGHYIYEPDGAVIRAGLVQQVGETLELWQLDSRIAYLSSDTWRVSPFVQGFEVEEQMPFNLKGIRRRLRELDVGVLEIKKRGINLDPDAFRLRLRLNGHESKTLIVTRIEDKPVAFLCRRRHTGSPERLPVNNDVDY